MLVPELGEYSQQQFDLATGTCPAIARYLGFLDSNEKSFEAQIRLHRHQAWLRSALAVYFNTASAESICRFWSDAADELIRLTWNHVGLDKEELAVMALGKLGSQELNLSSDVDLLIVGTPEFPADALKKIRHFKRTLNAATSLGFALRVDFDLRPDGVWGPLIVSIPHFQDHYWSRGETWERMALIRLRGLLGPNSIIENVYDLSRRFCYRKYLDFTLMEDLKSLRSRIHAKILTDPEDAIDLKLCVGGIRDAELFIHSLQMIHGGRTPDVQTTNTSEACKKLSQHLPEIAKSIQSLHQLYWAMRDLENKVQIYSDEQTHTLSKQGNFPQPIEDHWNAAKNHSTKINEIVSRMLGDLDHNSNRLPKSKDTQDQWLTQLGFSKGSIENVWPEIIKSSALSHKKDRDENARRDFLYTFVNALGEQATEKDLTLNIFLDFIRSIRAKSTLFNLILRNKKLLNKLVILFSKSPYMGQMIVSRPELIDSFLYGLHELSQDPEETLQLLFEKRQLAEIHGAIDFFENPDPQIVSYSLTSSADEVAAALKQLALGEVSGSEFDILCLGKWGSREMGFNSDLDFVLVKDGSITVEDHKASKRLINYMTSPQKGGRIYDIDMRLRPSGSSGPLLVTLENLKNYLKNQAQPWERQSYLKMRALSGEGLFSKDILVEKPLSKDDLLELERIRQKLLKPATPDSIDLKYAPGGLIEIEFAIQIEILSQQLTCPGESTQQLLQFLSERSKKWKPHCAEIEQAYLELRTWEQLLRLTTQSSTTSLNRNSDAMRRLSQHLKTNTDELFHKMVQTLSLCSRRLKDLDPIYTQD